jgi:hypothetical protein
VELPPCEANSDNHTVIPLDKRRKELAQKFVLRKSINLKHLLDFPVRILQYRASIDDAGIIDQDGRITTKRSRNLRRRRRNSVRTGDIALEIPDSSW